MAPRKSTAADKKVLEESSHDKAWVPSTMSEYKLDHLVEAGVLPDHEIAGWRPAAGEPFPMPHTNELVIFKEFLWHGFGVPVHPFLHNLLGYYDVSLFKLHPNSILHISIFINFYECYLGIPPHFNLFCHFFWLKRRGGSGSKVVEGVYL